MRGLGLWLWQLTKVSGGDPARIVALCRQLGARRLYVKVANAASTYPKGPRRALADACAAAGIELWGWSYVLDASGADPIAQARALADGCKAAGAVGCIVNAEKEYTDGRGPDAHTLDTLLGELRSQLPGPVPIGFSSFKFPVYFPDGPWHVLRAHGVFAMPQVYQWGSARNVGHQLRRSVTEWAALGLTVVPSLGSTLSTSDPHVLVEGAAAIAELSRVGGCLPVCDLWSLDQVEDLAAAWGPACREVDRILSSEDAQPHVRSFRCPLKTPRDVQAALLRLGVYPGPLTSAWKSAAVAAVKAFQEAHGLVVDGVAGPKTIEKIRAALDAGGLP